MDERRWEDVPVDEIHEWIEQRVNDQIADALDAVADEIGLRGRRVTDNTRPALEAVAHRIRSDRSKV